MKVQFLPEVEDYLFELIEILYHKKYFGFKESALKYIVDLKSDIESHLLTKLKRPAPPYFDCYGKKMLYAVFEKNRETHWYVFFNVYHEQDGQIVLLIRYISNNHTIAHFL